MNKRNARADIHQLTQGPIGKQLICFALPLFAGSLIQLLYNTVDLMFVGQILGAEASAAVGASSMIVNCILGVFTGLSVGVGVTAAKAVGSGDTEHLNKIIHSAAGLTCLLAFSLTVVGLFAAPACLRLMQTPENILPDATDYLRLYLLSLTAIVSYNIGSGILRALGNSRSPMVYQLIGGIANILGNTVFIYYLDWGVRGAALATACSQGLAAYLTVRHLYRLKTCCLRFRHISLNKTICKDFLKVGIPAAIQAMFITLSNLVVQTNINSLGVDSIAAFTAYYKVENGIYLPIVAFGQACSTFVSQNIGATQLERAKKGVRLSLVLGVAVTLVTSALTLIFAQFAFSLFARDVSVVNLGVRMSKVSYPFYFVYVFLEVFASAIRGSGKSLPTMVIILTNMFVVRICVLKIILYFLPSVVGVVAIYPITWVCTALCLGLYYRSGRWVPQNLKT